MTNDPWTRFWSRVRIGDGCWLWMGHVSKRHGYGKTSVDDRTRQAHRVAWALERGPIPEGLCVLHRCDNRRCVRPGHLFLGTKAENTADMVAKGRQARGDRHFARANPERLNPVRGERQWNARLNDTAVVEIRSRLRSGQTQQSVATRFGVSQSTIGRVARGVNWAHVRPSED
jgi:hypothetical protein